MRLTSKGRYAVMAIVDLAKHADTGRPVPLQEIAQRQEISLSYLEQLFARLRKGGIVSSVRGPGGGYRLAKTAADMTIADIIRAVEEPIRSTRCQQGGLKGCTGKSGRCNSHDLWEALGEQVGVFLSGVSLDDVVMRRVSVEAQGAQVAA
jgi:Rrf2 family transcriptional regulator, iron-sulfur cluster assembly transcription factor